MISDQRTFWNDQAATYDDAADHGLLDEDTREAWRELIAGLVPDGPATVADLGCGTGSLSVLLAEAGHRVTGVDQAPKMLEQARRKAAGLPIEFVQADASAPSLEAGTYDVVLSRHVLWALPDPADALRRWGDLLTPTGRFVLIEGRWWTGGGFDLATMRELLHPVATITQERRLTDPRLWGAEIADERYAVVAEVAT